MKISKLTKLAWVFIALMATSATIFGQGWKNRNSSISGLNNNCINQVSGLSDDQKSKIEELNKTHMGKMAELRKQRQSTADVIEKSEIRTTMLKNVKAHRDDVKSLLTDEQQKEYDQLQTASNYGFGRGNGNFQGRGQCRGQHWAGRNGYSQRGNRGGGYGYGNRQNRNCYRN